MASKFEKVTVTTTMHLEGLEVEVVKYRKAGTSRTFWTTEFEGLRITTTMFSQLGQAKKIARQFLIHKAGK